MKHLDNITLIGIDCVNVERLLLARDICIKDTSFANVKILTSLPSNDKDMVNIQPITSVEAYSYFCLTQLKDFVETDFCLVFQYDGFILNAMAWTDEFLNYDYIGSPWLGAQWLVDRFGWDRSMINTSVVGNGGFSLRSKRFLEVTADLVRNDVIKEYHPEDMAYSIWYRKEMEKQGICFAPTSLAEQFSFEAKDDNNDVWNNQFGFHGLMWTDISQWLDKNTEYKDRIHNNLAKYSTTN